MFFVAIALKMFKHGYYFESGTRIQRLSYLGWIRISSLADSTNMETMANPAPLSRPNLLQEVPTNSWSRVEARSDLLTLIKIIIFVSILAVTTNVKSGVSYQKGGNIFVL